MKRILPILPLTILCACAPTLESSHIPTIVTMPSAYPVTETLNRVAQEAQKLGFVVASRLDHAKAAKDAGLELRSTELLMIANPKGGTPLMQCAQTVGLDLPMKFLAYQNAAGQVMLSYNEPLALEKRHGARGCSEAFNKASQVLKNIAQQAVR